MSTAPLPPPPPELPPLTIAAGGQSLTIAGADGQPREIFVRLLRMAELPAYIAAANDEIALAALLTRLPPAELEQLPPLEVLRVLEVGHDLNFAAACRWAARRAKTAEAALESPKVRAAMEEMIRTALSAASSPTSPASPATA